MAAELKRLQYKDDEDERLEKEWNCWWRRLWALMMYGERKETEEERGKREGRSRDRVGVRERKGREFREKEEDLRRREGILGGLSDGDGDEGEEKLYAKAQVQVVEEEL